MRVMRIWTRRTALASMMFVIKCHLQKDFLNKLEVLYNAALILKQEVAEISKLDFPWPPLASDLTIDNVKKVVPHELFNTLAWICGLSSEPVFNEYVKISSKKMPN